MAYQEQNELWLGASWDPRELGIHLPLVQIGQLLVHLIMNRQVNQIRKPHRYPIEPLVGIRNRVMDAIELLREDLDAAAPLGMQVHD